MTGSLIACIFKYYRDIQIIGRQSLAIADFCMTLAINNVKIMFALKNIL